MDKTKKRIILYLGITFGLTYLFEFGVLYPLFLSNSVEKATIGQSLMAFGMLFPALGVLLTRLITKEGFKGSSYIVPKTGKRSIKWFVFAWFAPVILTVLGAVVYFLIYPEQYDPSMGYMADAMAASGVAATPRMLRLILVSQIVSGILLAPLLNAVFCFGEEWGWRGYLLPKMQEKLPMLPMLLINGIIWGLWHAPLTAIGHNYGMGYWGWPVTGILAMCAFCIVMGVIFSYITIKTGSCLPAMLAHGSLNGFAAAGIGFTDGKSFSPFVGPAPTGIIGGWAFIVCAVVMAIALVREKKAE